MKERYKILVLTDHTRHSDQNSIYAILNEMHGHPLCHSIMVASRGLENNQPFFSAENKDQLYGVKVSADFQYHPDGYYFKRNLISLNLADFDLVFLRLPRPLSDDFLKWLSVLCKGRPIINDPLGIIETSNKKFLLNFPDLCPEMKLCYSIEEIIHIAKKHSIVMKPLEEYGGRGLLRIKNMVLDDGIEKHDPRSYLSSISSTIESEGYLVMKYLENVVNGDKRILVAGGEILASSLRLPAPDSWLCNISQGGRSVESSVTAEEIKLVEKLDPTLSKKGIFIYGVDTLENDEGIRVLSEINTLSIGGFAQAEEQSGKPIIELLISKIFEYVAKWA